MKRFITAFAFLALAPSAFAQVTTGYYSDGQGFTCKVEVSDTNGSGTPGVDVTVTDAGGSRTTTGTQASGSTNDNPKAQSFPEGTTPRGSTSVKGENGKVKKKNAAGDWITLTKVEQPKDPKGQIEPPQAGAFSGPGSLSHGIGQQGTSLPGGPQRL
jgi:hypothetical protein